MQGLWKIGVVVILVAAVGMVMAGKQTRPAQPPVQGGQGSSPGAAPAQAEAPGVADRVAPQPAAALPRLVDLGAKKCIPCKMMAPILEELKTEYEGRLRVDFIDVWENPDQGQEYGIRLIPTQIFFDASGNELFRHEGFMPKEDILATWKELGVDLSGSAR